MYAASLLHDDIVDQLPPRTYHVQEQAFYLRIIGLVETTAKLIRSRTDPSYKTVVARILLLPCRQQNTGKLVWRLVYRISFFFKDAGAPDEN